MDILLRNYRLAVVSDNVHKTVPGTIALSSWICNA